MLSPISFLSLEKLIKVVPTTGSGPLQAVLSDGGNYFCKKSNFTTGCKYDLVNEVLAVNVLKSWGLFVPQYQFVKIDFEEIEVKLSDEYKRINNPESIIQIRNPFAREVFDTPFFASKEFLLHLHLEKLTSLENLQDFKVERLKDFFLILLFDLWFHNVDRKATNSNTLIASDESGKPRIAPIDHVQCFGVNRKFTSEKLHLLKEALPKELTLLQLRCVKELLLTLTKEERSYIANESTHLLEKGLISLKEESIIWPNEWNAHPYFEEVVQFLSDKKRNAQITLEFEKMLTI